MPGYCTALDPIGSMLDWLAGSQLKVSPRCVLTFLELAIAELALPPPPVWRVALSKSAAVHWTPWFNAAIDPSLLQAFAPAQRQPCT